MSEYEYNSHKPEKILTGYGTVRGAELRAIYSDIEGNTPLSQIESRFGRPKEGELETDHIDNTIRFLRTLDMVEQSGEDVLNRLNQDLFEEFELSFEPRLLYHIQQQTGRQAHLAAIHEIALKKMGDEGHYGVRRVSVDDLEIEVDRVTDYDLEWRSEKIQMWANLLAPIGAISYSTQLNEILLSPSRSLLHELLTHYQSTGEHGDSILYALDWIEENFFPVFSRAGGDPAVHVGIADVLESLVDDQVLTLSGMSDRSEVVDLPRSIDDSKRPADYSIDVAPDKPSYWYPLQRSEVRVVA